MDEDGNLKEEVITADDVQNKNLVRKRHAQLIDENNFYLRMDENIVAEVEDYGFPRPYINKCLSENVNNHCTTSYYLLCMDQHY